MTTPPETTNRRRQRRSPYATRPCRGCGVPVTRRVSDMREEVFHSLECYRKNGGEVLRKGGRPRTKTSTLVTCPDGEVRAANIQGDGYRTIYWPEHPNANQNNRVYEHVMVMADLLGRPLEPHETVHHKYGNRLDNRAEVLELWSKSQPAGQRVADKVDWALEMLTLYAPILTVEQRARLAAVCAGPA